MFGHVWWTWMLASMSCFWEVHMTKVSIFSVLSPLLGCRGQSRKNNQGSHPVSPWPHFHCISNYCSQTQIRHQVELRSQGTWRGAKKGSGGCPSEGERVMEGKQYRGACLYLPASSWRPTRHGPKPGSRGLCRFNDLFPRDQILHLNYH